MALASELVQGVDVWINTPRRPWEASGTSGMKVLVNGGLNLSELDGWWAEAYAPDVGWAIGDGREHVEPGWDAAETEQLFDLLERRWCRSSTTATPKASRARGWRASARASRRLTPRFSSNRMLAEYLERLYLPAAESTGGAPASTSDLRARSPRGSRAAASLAGHPLGQRRGTRRGGRTRLPRAGVPGRDPAGGRPRRVVRGDAPGRSTRVPPCGATTR